MSKRGHLKFAVSCHDFEGESGSDRYETNKKYTGDRNGCWFTVFGKEMRNAFVSWISPLTACIGVRLVCWMTRKAAVSI